MLLSDRNPFRVCVPSQNGLLLEPPQRHKDMTAMVAIDSPLSPWSTTGPFTMYGPFSTHWIVVFCSPQPLGMAALLSGFLECGDLGSVLEDRSAVSRLWHNREVELAVRTRFCEGLLFTIELEGFVLDMTATRADA